MRPRTARSVVMTAGLAVLGACASGSAGSSGSAPGSPEAGTRRATDPANPTFRAGDRLVREIAGIPVEGPDGAAYDHPFLGGLDVPRPQFADVDGDGDPDLFVQERTDELMFFENTGTAAEPRFVWRTDRFQELPVGEWARFHDMDDDGDLDLLAEAKFSYIRYFRNDGSATDPRYVAAADTVYSADGEAIFSDRQNIPNLTDIDCDGEVDLFLGRVDGTVARWEESGATASGVPRFELVTERFEDIEIVAAISVPGGAPAPGANLPPGNRPGGGTRLHGANSMAFADVDGDGDQDFFWGDFFEPGLLWIENLGSCARPDFRATPQPVPAEELIATSGYNAAALQDLDGDGDTDLLMGILGGAFNPNTTAADNLRYYEMQANGEFVERSRRFLSGIDVGSESYPTLGDLDGDGDLDMILGSKLDPSALNAARLYHFENTGTATAPRFVLRDTIPAADTYHLAPELVDLDGDGDLDIALGTWNRGVHWLMNQGTATEPDFVLGPDDGRVTLSRGSHATPALGDLDGDGDLDLLVGESSGEINWFRNAGTPSAPVWEEVTDQLPGVDVGRRAAPTLLDVDGDGDLDLLVGSEDGGIRFYENTGTPTEPDFREADFPSVRLPGFSTPTFRDIDGDGDLDLFSGGMGGGVVFYRNTSGG